MLPRGPGHRSRRRSRLPPGRHRPSRRWSISGRRSRTCGVARVVQHDVDTPAMGGGRLGQRRRWPSRSLSRLCRRCCWHRCRRRRRGRREADSQTQYRNWHRRRRSSEPVAVTDRLRADARGGPGLVTPPSLRPSERRHVAPAWRHHPLTGGDAAQEHERGDPPGNRSSTRRSPASQPVTTDVTNDTPPASNQRPGHAPLPVEKALYQSLRICCPTEPTAHRYDRSARGGGQDGSCRAGWFFADHPSYVRLVRRGRSTAASTRDRPGERVASDVRPRRRLFRPRWRSEHSAHSATVDDHRLRRVAQLLLRQGVPGRAARHRPLSDDAAAREHVAVLPPALLP